MKRETTTDIRLLIQDAGCTISDSTGKSWRAIIAPLHYKNKLYVEESAVPSGMINRQAYFYVGLPENDLRHYPRGTLFCCCGEMLTLNHCETTFLKDTPVYVWAVFNRYASQDENIVSLLGKE